jgi:hypothetical protein
MLVGAVILLAASVGWAAAGDHWLHVRVENTGSRPEHVSVNIPLSIVEAVLSAVEIDEFRGGRIHLDAADFDGFDLRELLAALRDAPDAEFVTVRSDDETVRVAKESGWLLVRVDEEHGGRVRVKIPLEVVEAMLSNDDELDVLSGLRALAEYEGEDLVLIESDHESVRIWIDTLPEGE